MNTPLLDSFMERQIMGGKSSPEYHAAYYQANKHKWRGRQGYRKKFARTPEGRLCERRYRVKHLYNLTHEEHVRLLEKQNHKCGIPGCDVAVTLFSDVDHNHACCAGPRSCGKCVRGILCHQHNNGLSFFEDNPQALLGAFEYLKECK